MSEMTIKAQDGGGSFSAYVSRPHAARAPGILVIQEIFGINRFIRDLCDHYASLGYLAAAPDLFWRLEPGLQLNPDKEEDSKKAFGLFGRFDVTKGVGDLTATLAALRADKGCNGKVGTVGYCLGGKLAYLMATRSDVDAAVGYYGVGIQDLLGEAAAITHPLLLHIAEEDKYTPPDAQAKIRAELGKVARVTVETYAGADHAFARVGGAHYVPAAASLANRRTEAFFADCLK
jgi:carboxymethylenebutenolidase